MRCALALSFACSSGCYERHGAREVLLDCDGFPPTCAMQREGPCGPWSLVDPICDASGLAACPSGATALDDPPDGEGATCLPMHREGGPMRRLGELLAGVEGEDGTCVWLGQDGEVVTSTGTGYGLSHPAAATRPSVRGCPGGEWVGGAFPRSALDEAPGARTSVLDAVRFEGRDLVAVRRYVWDREAPWPGLRSFGTAFATWDARDGALPIAPPTFAPHEETGDALALLDGRLLALSCGPSAEILHFDCALARLGDARDPSDRAAWRFQRGAGWVGARAEADTILTSGPERSTLRFVEGIGWVHLYVPGFGDTVMIRTSARPGSGWSAPRSLARCALPDDDPDAFCGSPVLRVERMDPRRPDLLVVTYSIASLAEDRDARRSAAPEAYWPRMMRARAR
ncbi:MAG: hypothetical protein KF729_34180 [Sandaracinaceae bacterium]|nr:hypothetical protein [Sandaracinaceae bacterium]